MRPKEKISIERYISELTSGKKIRVACNKNDYQKIIVYNNQFYISEEGKQKIISLEGLVKLEKYIKNIYLI